MLLANHFDGILFREHVDHLPFSFEREVKTLSDAKHRRLSFATSSRMVSRPTICSRPAIRSCSSPRLRSVAKISGARSRNSSRHREKTCGPNRYSRHISALSLTPESSSSTTWVLNSGVNARRFDIVFPPFGQILILLELSYLSSVWGSLHADLPRDSATATAGFDHGAGL